MLAIFFAGDVGLDPADRWRGHGRRVAVVLSATEYDALVQMKRERILAEIQVGLDQIDRGERTAYDEAGLNDLAERIKRAGAARAKEPGTTS